MARDAALGIEAEYLDHAGRLVRAPESTLKKLRELLHAERSNEGLGPVLVVRAGRPARLPLDDGMRWTLTTETGHRHTGRTPALPRLPLGYHRLVTEWRGGRRETTVIASPDRAYLPPAIQGARRAWGVSAQLYAVRSRHDWGIGDFGDLGELVARAGREGAALIGLNPLHALFRDAPEQASPYSPSSRLFVNPLYLDVTAIADFATCAPAQARASEPKFRAALMDARRASLVDYTAVAQLKGEILELLYASFRRRNSQARTRAFAAFRRERGPALRRFALYETIREQARNGARAWRRWPATLRDPETPAARRFVRDNIVRIEFHEYLQWQADLQLGACAARARASGMQIGLYRDLAVGVDPGGADSWLFGDLSVPGWSIGAPPDAWNLKGQVWGLEPLNPSVLRAQAYRPFIELLRANMRHAGGVRIDHILGLKRLFWVPEGAPASAGAYVRYPFEELMAVVALESVRNRCLVVGEDLGTVPPGFRTALHAKGILSCQLAYFARDRRGDFLPPSRWTRDALASVSTHDLPTLAGYWSGADLKVKQSLSLYPDRTAARRDRRERTRDRRLLGEAIGGTQDQDFGARVHRFLGRTKSRLAVMQLEDLAGAAEQVNVPGTVDEHPNWRRRLPVPLDELFSDPLSRRRLHALSEGRSPRRAPEPAQPRATYRVQLHKDFDFRRAAAIVPYLSRLGVSHLYVSPILEAQPGSTHGYDAVRFDRINPELGGLDGFIKLSDTLRAHGMGLIVDFAPNHMGVGGASNPHWLELLRRGRNSPAGRMFDVDWDAPDGDGRVVVPFLGDDLPHVIARGELRRARQRGGTVLRYFGDVFPVRGPQTPDLAELLDRQAYRLVSWRNAPTSINYRRFFDISRLAAVRMEDPAVFARAHRLIARLIRDRRIDGLRIDHIDGLYDPAAYLRRLRRLIGRPEFHLSVEKILAADEALPRDWPIAGTTGYEFVNLVNGLFVDRANADALARIYGDFTGEQATFGEILRDAKRQVIETLFPRDLSRLADRIPGNEDDVRVRPAIAAVAACFPIYRTYVTGRGISARDSRIIADAVGTARELLPTIGTATFARVQRAMRGGAPEFAMRFQQFTAPVTAKALEDTSFYRFNRLLSLNEVGGDPGRFGVGPGEFLTRMAAQQRLWPAALLATATHDTKRGEDARARINVISEVPVQWRARLERWDRFNRTHLDEAGPSRNDQYLIYQSLLGAWPMPPARPNGLAERIKAYVLKATREAKVHTSWHDPQPIYEAACARFVDRILSSRAFVADFDRFARDVARLGALNSLAQITFKLTAPGVPDTYQGCEGWDFSLVDPDNRRPVDYDRLQKLIEATVPDDWRSDAGKARLIAGLLRARRAYPDLFAAGDIRQVRVEGPARTHVVAFSRRRDGRELVVAVGRLFAGLYGFGRAPRVDAWRGTRLVDPDWRGRSFADLAADSPARMSDGGLSLADVFAARPIAVLLAAREPLG